MTLVRCRGAFNEDKSSQGGFIGARMSQGEIQYAEVSWDGQDER